MENAAKVKDLKQKRTTFKGQLTRFKSFLEENESDTDFVQVRSRLQKLDARFKEFELHHTELQTIDSAVDHLSERLDIEDDYFAAEAKANRLLLKDSTNALERNGSGFSHASPNPRSNTSDFDDDVGLPKLNLPSFSGAYEDWPGFSDQFKSSVHDNVRLSDSSKLTYSRSCLTGEARKRIEIFNNAAANYSRAWATLEKQYNEPILLVANRIKAIFEAPTVHKACSRELREFINRTEIHYAALKMIGHPSVDTVLIHLLKGKLDKDTAQRWKEHDHASDFPTVEEFFEFLNKRCKHLEPSGEDASPRPTASKTPHALNHNPRHGKHQSPRNTPRIAYAAQTENKCTICQGNHNIYRCSKILNAAVIDRAAIVKRAGLCSNCLRPDHVVAECKSGYNCKTCDRRHHTLLHVKSEQQTSNTQANTACLKVDSSAQVILSTALVGILDDGGQRHACRVLIDNGSQSHFMTDAMANKLRLKRTKVSTPVTGIAQTVTRVTHSVSTEIKSRCNNFGVNAKFLILPKLAERLPSRPVTRNSLRIPRNLKLADPKFHQPAEIDVILGSSIFHKLLCVGKVTLANDSIALLKTQFGWIVTGEIEGGSESTSVSCNLSTRILESELSKFWEFSDAPGEKPLSAEENACEEHYSQNTRRDVATGRYIVKLPFKEHPDTLGESHTTALKRFYSLERSLNRNHELRVQYNNFLREYLELGHMSEIKNANKTEGYYMPHHAVLKQASITTKLRVVFDASARTSNRTSLNNILMIGPTIQDDLFTILVRFRSHVYALTADITKMYRQIILDPSDRKYQRILWREDPVLPIRTYALNTVTYGTSSASFLAIRTLRQLAADEAEAHPLAASILTRDFYVDDMLTGARTLQEAAQIRDDVIELLAKGGCQLRQWASNDLRLLHPLQEQSDEAQICLNTDRATKALGIGWNPREDIISYNVNLKDTASRVTKRSILGQIAQLFDPLGLLGPTVVLGKLLIQRLWQLKTDWDESVPMDIHTTWTRYREQLPKVQDLKVQRKIIPDELASLQLHGFCDASERAYGACIYTRCVNRDGKISVHLVCSRSRVAPLKSISLPRLELCAALLLANLYDNASRALQTQVEKTIFWSDSMIALHWIRTPPNTLKTFVANRVGEIQRLTTHHQWRHISSSDNPADVISRGLMPSELVECTLWQTGPSWLAQAEEGWPHSQLSVIPIPEIRPLRALISTAADENEILRRHSSFLKLKRVWAYCMRWRYNVLDKRNYKGNLTVEELNMATSKIIILTQTEAFSELITAINTSETPRHRGQISALNPFIDDQGILRVGGRLANADLPFKQRHPALLPSKHHITKLIIREEHEKNMHAGTQATLCSIRERYWVTDGRATVRSVIRKCVICNRARPISFEPMMGTLPRDRVTLGRPFTTVGIDYCGPFFVKERTHRNRGKVKVYAAIFVCFATKAVHIEIVSDLTTEAFIASLKRFFARRGKSKRIYSDNATNFVGANRELKTIVDHLNEPSRNDDVSHFLSHEGVEWHFIPPRSPHFGGLWEAAVKSFKNHMTRVVGDTILSYEALMTYATEIEAILNSRPLTPLSADPNDLDALTPAHFLIGDSLRGVPELDLTDTKSNHLSMWRHVQKMKQHFWARWHKEYLHELTVRRKWHTGSTANIQVDQLVTIHEDNLPPMRWKMGRVVSIHPGTDGVVRVVTVKTPSGEYKRSVKKLSPLLLSDSD